MAITHANVQEVHLPQEETVQTLSSYVVPAGDDKILVITSSNSTNAGSLTTPSATFDGNAMTLIQFQNRSGGGFGALAMFYYLLGSSTPTGDIVVTWNRQANQGWGIHAITLTGAEQQAPEASAKTNTTTGNPISQAVTTLTGSAYIVDGVRSDASFTNNAVNGDPAQTEIDDIGNDAHNRHSTSFLAATAAASYTMAWTQSANDDKQLIVAAWEEAAAAGGTTVVVSAGLLGFSTPVSIDLSLATQPASLVITGQDNFLDEAMTIAKSTLPLSRPLSVDQTLLTQEGDINVFGTEIVIAQGLTAEVSAGAVTLDGQILTVAQAGTIAKGLIAFGRPVSINQTNLIAAGDVSVVGKAITLFQSQALPFTKGLLNIIGQPLSIDQIVLVAKGFIRVRGRTVNFLIDGIEAAYRMAWGKGVSPKKGVGFKKVGAENVSRVSNPETTGEE